MLDALPVLTFLVLGFTMLTFLVLGFTVLLFFMFASNSTETQGSCKGSHE